MTSDLDRAPQRMNPAQRRYFTRFVAVMTAYVAILLGVVWLFKHEPPEGSLRYLIAILPALPEIGIIAVMALYLIEERDEFLRMRQSLALLIGLGGTLSVTSAWGFLEAFAQVPHLDAFSIFPIFCFLWGTATGVLAWVYR